MTVQWYFGRGADITGPMSGKELSDLAASGDVLPSDTVWREGVEMGVPAHTVRNLFRNAPAAPGGDTARSTATSQPVAEAAAATPEPNALPDDAELKPMEEPPAAESEQRAVQNAKRKARATAGRGVVIVGQDGTTVKYRKKCTTCGFEDSSWKTMAIARGTTRLSFFCPKCRKKRDGEIHGIVL
jgi:GYF domain 2